MRETIILAPGLNGTELTRSLALHGVDTIGLRVMNAAELARLALMRSGIAVKENYIDRNAELALVRKAAGNGQTYFGRNPSYADIARIAEALRFMRMLAGSGDEAAILHGKLPQGPFASKNRALLDVYDAYIDLLKTSNSVDELAIIRRAAEQGIPIDADCVIFEEFPLKPLERALIDRLSGGNTRKSTVADLFGVVLGGPHIDSYKDCFGAPNEVEAILEDAYSKKLDRCTVAVPDVRTYSQLFFDYATRYAIPVSFGCGIPITNSRSGQLLSLYHRWTTSGFFGARAIRDMLLSDAFDRKRLKRTLEERGALSPFGQSDWFSLDTLLEYLGNIRFENDSMINRRRIENYSKAVKEWLEIAEKHASKQRDLDDARRKVWYLPCLEAIGVELALPVEDFIVKYASCRAGDATPPQALLKALDESAIKTIRNTLASIRATGFDRPEQYASSVLSGMACRQPNASGHLHLTSVAGAFAALRDNLYIAGLSASKYPGRPQEDPLLLDEDIRLFGEGAEPFMSDELALRKGQSLLALAELSTALGASTSISFAGMDVSELKKDNASSLLFRLYEEEHGRSITPEELKESALEEIGYFQPAISASRKIGDAYINGKPIAQTPRVVSAPSAQTSWSLDRQFSPSSLGIFFSCPKRFLLQCLLGIPEPDSPEDSGMVISALDQGNLAHALMERLAESPMDEEEFTHLAQEYFDRFICEHPPAIPENIPEVKADFCEMMATAIRQNPAANVVLHEEELSCKHSSGVMLHGIPDRIERLASGDCVIVDFKTGRNLEHRENDMVTCFQGIVYAYLFEHGKKERVERAEFRYLRRGETVACEYTPAIEQMLDNWLVEFKEHMEKGSFPTSCYAGGGDPNHPDPCRYCSYGDICGK